MLSEVELLGIVVCPSCKAPLEDLIRCRSCQTAFIADSGTPSLIPVVATKEVSFKFSSARSVSSPRFKEAFHYPPLPETSDDLPYHLDPAHALLLSQLPKGAAVLEIGCGGGQMRDYLAKREVKYVGVDITTGERVTEDLRVHGGPDLLCDAHFLPFADEAFDFVYTSALVEHLASPYIVAQEVRRTLKPGGTFVGSVSFLEPWHDDSFYHMTPLGVFEMLAQAELEAKYVWPGRGYSGFHAMMMMGNKATRKTAILGKLNTAIYRGGNRLRNALRPRDDINQIDDDARCSGSTDWIAVKTRTTVSAAA